MKLAQPQPGDNVRSSGHGVGRITADGDQLVKAKQAWNTDEAADGQWASEPTVVTPWQAILLDSTGWIVALWAEGSLS